jgi:putative ABC transport system permease protein
LETVTGILAAIGAAARAVTGLTLVVGTLVLAGAVIAGHHRRVYDAIVLKVLGATRRDLLAAYALEYGVLGLATAFIAIAIGTLASWGVVTFLMRADWVFLLLPVAGVTLLSLGITLVLGFAGTWIALGQKAAPLLRQG